MELQTHRHKGEREHTKVSELEAGTITIAYLLLKQPASSVFLCWSVLIRWQKVPDADISNFSNSQTWPCDPVLDNEMKGIMCQEVSFLS